jgi:hypothetical protein
LQFLREICCSSLIKHDAPSEKNWNIFCS